MTNFIQSDKHIIPHLGLLWTPACNCQPVVMRKRGSSGLYGISNCTSGTFAAPYGGPPECFHCRRWYEQVRDVDN